MLESVQKVGMSKVMVVVCMELIYVQIVESFGMIGEWKQFE